MKHILHAIIFGFKEILTWNTMKYALISGVLISALWIGIGFSVWDSLIALSSHIIELVPFSMVRSNGAWMLSTFLFIQLVIITFALIFAFLGNLILRYISKEKYTIFTILVAMGTTIFWAIVWVFKGDVIYDKFLQLLTWLPFETVEKGIAFLIAFYFIYNAIIVSMVFVSSFFSEALIQKVEAEHFKNEEIVRDHLFSSIGYTIRNTLIFIVVSLLTFPLLFIPVLNIIVQVILWIWLIKDTMSHDAAALVYKNVKDAPIKEHTFAIWMISFIASLFNFIPILNVFGAFFGEIAMFHYFKSLESKNTTTH